MLTDRPGRPKGRHVRQLRTHLGLTQTRLGALLGLHQPDVSKWEGEEKDEFLPLDLARRFLQVWDCFPMRPEGGFDEMMATLASLRGANAAAPLSQLPGKRLIRLVPEEPVSAEPPEIFWVSGEHPRSEGSASEPSRAGPAPQPSHPAASGYEREVIQFRLGLSSALILFSVWSRARSRQSAMPSRWFWRWATAASVALLLCPMGCFQIQRAALQTGRASRGAEQECAEHETDPVPGQIDTDDAKKADRGDKSRRSIPMPQKPYSWQKVAPCDGGEAEKRGGCWQELMKEHPPCPRYAVESEGECLLPVPAAPKSPRSVTPEP